MEVISSSWRKPCPRNGKKDFKNLQKKSAKLNKLNSKNSDKNLKETHSPAEFLYRKNLMKLALSLKSSNNLLVPQGTRRLLGKANKNEAKKKTVRQAAEVQDSKNTYKHVGNCMPTYIAN